ncbi:MAG: hypothetical protein JO154_26205 [Chitinophaga sp.]|uniref:hypothetical protein n=1 Tax=Chitinophaga sp. TaxID=1869181 RepID=UPI0025BA57D4|nr:hypothetical protein [Chitinophaga sp.]MBV8256115.1 hypothetical protein [Chitinophaga sp.]
MRKTKWLIAADKIQLYPFRVYRPIAVVVGIILIALWTFCVRDSPRLQQGASAINGYAIVVFFCALWFAYGNTIVIFDAGQRRFFRKLGGLISTSGISFDDLAAIQGVTHNTSVVFRAFTKQNRHGKGHTISSYYGGWNDKDAIVFQEEVLPALDHMVFGAAESRPVATYVPITDFSFYSPKDGGYELKQRKIGLIIFVLALLAWWIYGLTHPEFANKGNSTAHNIAVWFPFVLLVIFAYAYGSCMFDKQNGKMVRTYFFGFVKKEYMFTDFVRFHIVRKTTNFTYSGTEIRMEFAIPNTNKSRFISLRNFNGTKQIDRFLEETSDIMGVRR